LLVTKRGLPKAQKRLLHTILNPQITWSVQEENVLQRRLQHLHGDIALQVQSRQIFTNLQSKIEVIFLLESPKLFHVDTRPRYAILVLYIGVVCIKMT